MRNPDNFKAFDECRRQVSQEVAVHQRVMALRHDMTAEHRKAIALQSLERAVMALEILGEDIADAAVTSRLDEIESRLSRLRFRFRMHQGLVHLAGIFGRAP